MAYEYGQMGVALISDSYWLDDLLWTINMESNLFNSLIAELVIVADSESFFVLH